MPKHPMCHGVWEGCTPTSSPSFLSQLQQPFPIPLKLSDTTISPLPMPYIYLGLYQERPAGGAEAPFSPALDRTSDPTRTLSLPSFPPQREQDWALCPLDDPSLSCWPLKGDLSKRQLLLQALGCPSCLVAEGVPRGQAAAGGAAPGRVGQKAAAGGRKRKEKGEKEEKKEKEKEEEEIKDREELWFPGSCPK